jgi:predicted dehydrogenase
MPAAESLGIIVNGATSSIANRQHLAQALIPIIAEGGLPIGGRTVVPMPLLVGRDPVRLKAVAERFGLGAWSTDLDTALADERFPVFFDAGHTGGRAARLRAALAAGKHVYTEKPFVTDIAEGRDIERLAVDRGLKIGVVEDKLFMPGPTMLRLVCESGQLGRIVNFRLDFGYWIFSHPDGPPQRPSWNYRKSDGGSMILDMYPHWRYLVEGIVGAIRRVVAAAWTAIPERLDEGGAPYHVDTDDSTATLVELESGAFGTITSSWVTRVKRDDLVVFQVDGTNGSAAAGIHRCCVQSLAATPRALFDPTRDHGRDYHADWSAAPYDPPLTNGYRMGWEAFLRHVVVDAPLTADVTAGLRDVALAKACQASVEEERWVPLSRFV